MAELHHEVGPHGDDLDPRIDGDIVRAHRVHEFSQTAIAIGTRASQLALVQAESVQKSLLPFCKNLDVIITPMSSAGDRDKVRPLNQLAGKALWTEELEVALLEGAIDCIVHSLKDVPTALPEGCALGAIPEREDPTDCFVAKDGLQYTCMDDLPHGSVVGTSSTRRKAQLRKTYPHIQFEECRGNIGTRLSKLDNPSGPFSALILASAGLRRLNLSHRITSTITSPTLYHAVGQGALCIEIRKNDKRMAALISQLDHWQTSWTTSCERSLLRVLEGGCSVPVGVETTIQELSSNGLTNGHARTTARLSLKAMISSPSTDLSIKHEAERIVSSLEEAEELGAEVAKYLIQHGARPILEEVGRTVKY